MADVLTSGVAEKAVGDRVRFAMDFGDIRQLIEGYTISQFTVTCSGLTAASAQLDYAYQVSALFSGGVAGTNYDAVYTITLDDPDATVISRTGVIKVK